ncbi:SCP2 sterol-binding domain-containing protein [Caulobacter sp. 1776]|uniref:ubiquinone anaerobic biosynthesis accessory factor UbiT n=1 Tax=Caulobacter sp. 1776 TaxID=3156420 RepID=UPI00339AB4B4
MAAIAAKSLLLGPSYILTLALRRLVRIHPDAFARLAAYRESLFLIEFTDAPLAFSLRPSGTSGQVRVLSTAAAKTVRADVRIAGQMVDLLRVFDGTFDADAAFFSRRIRVAGDTSALMALHNALEAADLTLADLIGAPASARGLVNRGLDWTLHHWRSA